MIIPGNLVKNEKFALPKSTCTTVHSEYEYKYRNAQF